MQTKESIMRHALGLSDSNRRPRRNRYAYDAASTTGILIKQLIDAGHMVHARRAPTTKEHHLNNAHVTMEGLMSLNIEGFSTLPGTVEINGALVPTFDD